MPVTASAAMPTTRLKPADHESPSPEPWLPPLIVASASVDRVNDRIVNKYDALM